MFTMAESTKTIGIWLGQSSNWQRTTRRSFDTCLCEVSGREGLFPRRLSLKGVSQATIYNLQYRAGCFINSGLAEILWCGSVRSRHIPSAFHPTEKSFVLDLHSTTSDQTCFAILYHSYWPSYFSPQESIQIHWKKDKPNSTQVSTAKVLILRLFRCSKIMMLQCLTV